MHILLQPKIRRLDKSATRLSKAKRVSKRRRKYFEDSFLAEPDEEEGVVGKCCTKICDAYDYLGLKHFTLILVLVGYSVLGAKIFMECEAEADNKEKWDAFQKQMNSRNERLKYQDILYRRFIDLAKVQASLSDATGSFLSSEQQQMKRLYLEAIQWYELSTYGPEFNKTPELQKTQWDLWGGMFYAGTLYTTIGYGTIYAKTFEGQIATMIYSMIGIPITITILNDWGDLMFRLACYIWIRFLFACFAVAKCCPGGCGRFFQKLFKPNMEMKADGALPDNKDVPFIVTLLLLFFWIWLCSAVFKANEGWEWFQSIYFFFISLTTIGLGDIAPEDHRFTCMAFMLVLIGLAVVGMAINVVQAKIDSAFDDLVSQIEKDYKKRLEEEEEEEMRALQAVSDSTGVGTEDVEANAYRQANGSVVIKQSAAEHVPGIKPKKKRPKASLKHRIMYRIMGEHKRKLLQAKFETLSNLRNIGTQTDNTKVDSGIQCDPKERTAQIPTFVDIDPDDSGGLLSGDALLSGAIDRGGAAGKRMYIYNIGDK